MKQFWLVGVLVLSSMNLFAIDTPLQIDSSVGNRTLILPRGSTSGKIRHAFDSYISVYAKASEKLKPNHEEYQLQMRFDEVRLADCMEKYEKLQKDVLLLFKQLRYDDKYYELSAPFFKKQFKTDEEGKEEQVGYMLVADLIIETPPKLRVKTLLTRLLSYESIRLKKVVQSHTAYEATKEKVLLEALTKAKKRAEAIADTFKLDLDEVQQVEELESTASDKLVLEAEEEFGYPVGLIEVEAEIKVIFEVH